MKFINFTNNRLQEIAASVAEQTQTFSILKDAKSSALQNLLKLYRFAAMCLLLPKVIAHFFAVKLGVVKKPEPILEIMNDRLAQEEEQKRLAKIGKKVGFATPKAVPNDIA